MLRCERQTYRRPTTQKSTNLFPQDLISDKTLFNARPFDVSEYSTLGGTSAKTSLTTIPFSSNCFNSFTNILVLMPFTLLSKS